MQTHKRMQKKDTPKFEGAMFRYTEEPDEVI